MAAVAPTLPSPDQGPDPLVLAQEALDLWTAGFDAWTSYLGALTHPGAKAETHVYADI